MPSLRRTIGTEVRKLVSSSPNAAPAWRGGLGYFEPDAVARRVHGDFTTMLAGGVSALLLQMLHPGALAGVWDHSDFRQDMAGRLRGTAQFIAITTYGSFAEADAIIARVQAIHDRVHGVRADGTPYSANDPHLLTWVHIAGAWSFLASYERFAGRLTPAEADRYFAETVPIAELLGATKVPASKSEAEDYLLRMRPELRADERSAEVAQVLLNEPAPKWAMEPARRVVMDAGIGLLPRWAAEMHGFPRRRLGMATDGALIGLRKVAGWALRADARA
jgi:uncharacterized protein (DUF2236 family)